MSKPKKPKAPAPISLRIDEALSSELEAAAQETKLNKSDLVRLSVERGLKILLEQLRAPVKTAA